MDIVDAGKSIFGAIPLYACAGYCGVISKQLPARVTNPKQVQREGEEKETAQ
jgi:hypothetical protein